MLWVIVSIGGLYGGISMYEKHINQQENKSIQQRKDSGSTTQDYYEQFKDINPIISTSQAKELFPTLDLKYNTILDVRESSEYDIGNIPWSIHIRSADLIAWKRKDLDPHKITYVICAQSLRGKRISNFLKSKWIIARYLEHGHQHYYKHWWLREWNNWYYDYRTWGNYLSFLNENSLTQYQQDESKDILYLYASDPEENSEWLLDHSISQQAILFPYMYMTTEAINEQFRTLKSQSSKKKVITIYHGRLELFDAVNLWIEAEKRGYEFLWSFGW